MSCFRLDSSWTLSFLDLTFYLSYGWWPVSWWPHMTSRVIVEFQPLDLVLEIKGWKNGPLSNDSRAQEGSNHTLLLISWLKSKHIMFRQVDISSIRFLMDHRGHGHKYVLDTDTSKTQDFEHVCLPISKDTNSDTRFLRLWIRIRTVTAVMTDMKY